MDSFSPPLSSGQFTKTTGDDKSNGNKSPIPTYSSVKDDPLYEAIQLMEKEKNQKPKAKTEHNKLLVKVPPSYIGDEEEGIVNVLEDLKMKYVSELRAYLLDYSNVQVVGDYGVIPTDKPYVCWTIEADFELFRPTVGDIYEGMITSHLPKDIVTLYQTIQVEVTYPEVIPPDLSKYFFLGFYIHFRLTKVSGDKFFGIVDDECLAAMRKKRFPIAEAISIRDDNDYQEEEYEFDGNERGQSPEYDFPEDYDEADFKNGSDREQVVLKGGHLYE